MYNNYEIKQIATRLKYLREASDVSVEEAARVAQVSISEYRDAEAGKVDFTFNFLQKLAKQHQWQKPFGCGNGLGPRDTECCARLI